jgi:hypothetical protein
MKTPFVHITLTSAEDTDCNRTLNSLGRWKSPIRLKEPVKKKTNDIKTILLGCNYITKKKSY